jgi:3-hydroxyisobutyrate dehydrogenase-like beta-hydroxyacid dehydrogenase
MSDVTVIGLGLMGTALARGLIHGGQRVTVWNRTPTKAAPLVDEGATLAESPATAALASPVTIVCLDGYATAREILGTETAEAALSGRTLVQLSTGTPREARDTETWARGISASYIDGAILASPARIATPTCTLLLAGERSAFEASEPALRILAPSLRYLGEQVGAASALDCAILSMVVGWMLGTDHGVRVAETEELLVEFAELAAAVAPRIVEHVAHITSVVQGDSYMDPQATVKTWAAATQHIRQQAIDAGINDEFPTLAADLFRRTVDAGYGDEDAVALVKILRN